MSRAFARLERTLGQPSGQGHTFKLGVRHRATSLRRVQCSSYSMLFARTIPESFHVAPRRGGVQCASHNGRKSCPIGFSAAPRRPVSGKDAYRDDPFAAADAAEEAARVTATPSRDAPDGDRDYPPPVYAADRPPPPRRPCARPTLRGVEPRSSAGPPGRRDDGGGAARRPDRGRHRLRHPRQGRGHPRLRRGPAGRRPRHRRGLPGSGQDPAGQVARQVHRLPFRPGPVHPRPPAQRRHRRHGVQPEERGVRVPARAHLRQHRPRRRDQPGLAQDPVEPARVHGRAPGDHRQRHASR